MEKRIAFTISKHSTLTEAEITALFQQGEGKDVDFALQKGIITAIKLPEVPTGAIHLAMVFV